MSIVTDIGGDEVKTRLLAIVKDKQDANEVRRDALAALERLGERTVVSDLLAIVKDKQDANEVRQYATHALGKLGERAVVPELLAIVKDKQGSRYARLGAVEALGELEERTVVPELLAILKDKQDANVVRRHAAQVLGKLEGRAVVPELLAIVKNKQNHKFAQWRALVTFRKLSEHEREERYLIHLLSSIALLRLRSHIEDVINECVRDLPTIRATAKLLRSRNKNLVDTIHESLWTVSQGEKVRILMIDWKFIKLVKVRRR